MDADFSYAGKIIWVVFIVVWGAIRWRPNVRARRNAIKATHRSMKERLSLVVSFAGLGLLPGVWVFLDFPQSANHAVGPIALAIAVVLLIGSLVMFRLTHRALGRMWSNSLDLRQGHELITTSVYTRLRHPMYTAFWLWAFAQAFLLGNWVAAPAGIIGFGALFFLRVGDEEAMMEREFGESYRQYAKRTKRVVPGIY